MNAFLEGSLGSDILIEDMRQHESSYELPQLPILLTGAGSGLGRKLAIEYATRGYLVIGGTRTSENFESLYEDIKKADGVPPRPFLADLTNVEDLKEALAHFPVRAGRPMHYMPLAAGGLESIKWAIGRPFSPLLRARKDGLPITDEMLETARQKIKETITDPKRMDAPLAINRYAPLAIATALEVRGNLTEESTLISASSSLSDNCDPAHPENYPGPWFYYTIGMSKEQGVRALRQKTRSLRASYVNFVIPEISDTGVGEFFELVSSLLEYAGKKVEIPSVTTDQAANSIVSELQKQYSPKIRTVYIDSNGPTDTKPASFNTSLTSTYF
jgi:hypothetical protein